MRQIKFDQLDLSQKSLLLAEFGEFLDSMEFYDYRVHLYSLNNYFIEVYYNIESRQVDKISVAGYNDLDKFLTRISFTYK